MYCEDVDLSWRAKGYGFALRMCPRALFLHEVTNREYLECVRAGKCAPFRDDVARRFGAGPEEGFRGDDQPVDWSLLLHRGTDCARDLQCT